MHSIGRWLLCAALCAAGWSAASAAEVAFAPRACALRPRAQQAVKRSDTILALMLRENCRQAAALGAMHVRIEDADDDPDEDPAWGHEGADSYPGDDPYPVAVRPGGARTFGFLGTPALGGTSRPSHGALPPGVTVRHTRSLVLDAESRRGPPLA